MIIYEKTTLLSKLSFLTSIQSMSTQTLALIQLEMTRIGLPIFISIGNLSSLIGLSVFLQTPMRRNSCIFILIGYMISNLIYLNFTVLSVVLSSYGFDFSIRSVPLCRLRMYMSYVFSIIPTYLLILASFDRMCISSLTVRTRSIPTRRFSIFTTVAIVLFWSLFHLHAFFTSELQNITNTKVSCVTQPGVMTTLITYYSLICGGIIPITLILIFGLRTLINVRKSNRTGVHRREIRLISLLIAQITIYLCLRVPTSIYFIYQEATKFHVKKIDRILADRFVFFLTLFSQFIQVSISPMLNLTSHCFRSEFRRVLMRFRNKFFCSAARDIDVRRNPVNAIHPMN